jgi:hypothetical protein
LRQLVLKRQFALRRQFVSRGELVSKNQLVSILIVAVYQCYPPKVGYLLIPILGGPWEPPFWNIPAVREINRGM